LYGNFNIRLRALRHATQKVSIMALSEAQSSALYILVQYDLNDFSSTVKYLSYKKAQNVVGLVSKSVTSLDNIIAIKER